MRVTTGYADKEENERGSGHVLECKGLPSMDVMVATAWNCPTCISMAPHGVTGLTCTKCNTGYSMECFHGNAGMTMVVNKLLK